MPDATLYEIRNKADTIEESPSGRLLLDDEPLQVGEVIEIAGTLGRWTRATVEHDGHEWYAVIAPRPYARRQEVALLPGLRVRRA